MNFVHRRATVLIVLWIAINLVIAWWARSLPMNNAESLFMSSAASADYQAFRDLVGERRVLAVKIELDHDMGELEYTGIRDGIRALKEQFQEPDFEWLDFHSTYQRKIGSGSFSDASNFWNSESHLLLPLFGRRHGGFVVMMNWNVDDAKITELTKAIRSASSFRVGHIAMAGLPWVNLKLNEYAEDIKVVLMPLMMVVCFALTWFIVRSLSATILLIVPCVFAMSFSMGFIKLIYGSLNMITAVVPLRVFVINLTLCFYIYFSAVRRGSLRAAIEAKWKPLAMGLTATALGFGSNAISSIPAVRELAVIAMIAVLSAGLSSVAALWLVDPLWNRGTGTFFPTRLHGARFSFPIWSPTVQRIAFFGLSIAAALAITKIQILTDATQYFPKSSGIKSDLDVVENGFLGTPVFEIVLRKDDGSEFSFDDYKIIGAIETNLIDKLGQPYKSLSLNTLAREANRLFSGVDTPPDNKFAWTTLMGGLPENVKTSYPRGKIYRMSLLGSALNHDKFLADSKIIKDVLTKLPSPVHFELSGLNYNLMQSQEDLLKILTLSFIGSLGVILIMFYGFFRDVKATIRFGLLTITPMLCGVCIIPLFGFSLNIATIMSFGVSLGMLVSGLIHVKYEQRKLQSDEQLHQETLFPLAAAAVVLFVGFGLFGFNQFLPIHQEGTLVAIMIAVGGMIAITTRKSLSQA